MPTITDLFVEACKAGHPDDIKLDLSNNIAKFLDDDKEVEKNREIFVNYVTLVKSNLQQNINLKTIKEYIVNHSNAIDAVRALLNAIIVLPDDSGDVEYDHFNFTTEEMIQFEKDDTDSIEKSSEIIKRTGVKIDKLNLNTIADELAPFILKSVETSFIDSFSLLLR